MTTESNKTQQAEELAGMLMTAFHRRVKADPLGTFRETQDTEARHCWVTACDIQEMLAPAWELLTPERLKQIRQDGQRFEFWIAIQGAQEAALGYWEPTYNAFSVDEVGRVSADTITHIMPFTIPEMPK